MKNIHLNSYIISFQTAISQVCVSNDPSGVCMADIATLSREPTTLKIDFVSNHLLCFEEIYQPKSVSITWKSKLLLKQHEVIFYQDKLLLLFCHESFCLFITFCNVCLALISILLYTKKINKVNGMSVLV